MRTCPLRSSGILRGLRAAGLLAVVSSAGSCHAIDTTRQAAAKAYLGDDVYGVLCDRIGASVLSAFLLFGAFGGMLGGTLSDRFGRMPVIIVSLLLAPVPVWR